MIYFLGIDPGLRGAWCRVDVNGRIVNYGLLHMAKLGLYKFPDIRKVMTDWYDCLQIVLEEQCAMPGNPVKSLAQQCAGYGALVGQLYAHPFNFNIVQVRPSVWTGDLVRAGFGKSKNESGLKVTLTDEFKAAVGGEKIKHDGVLDAAGLAAWRAWTLNGELRRRRIELGRLQGLERLGDTWIIK